MNQVLKTIAERNSCRNFSPAPIPEEQITALVNAALAAPSALNRQPWQIIVITDKQLLDEMDAHTMDVLKAESEFFYNRMMDRGGKVFYNAPCLIVIAKDDSDYAAIDSGIVSQNITLAAHSMGLGSVICGVAANTFKGEKYGKLIPEGYAFGISVAVGTAISGKDPHELEPSKVTYIRGAQ